MQKTNYYKKTFSKFPLQGVFVGCFYDGAVQQKLRRFKFVHNTVDTVYFENIFSGLIKESGIKNNPNIIIVYPPISLKDRILRGPNHAKKLAEIFASLLGSENIVCPFYKNIFAGHQSQRNRTERKQSLSEYYLKGFKSNTLRGKDIIIIDDIITTGYTMYTLGSLLQGLGVKEITGFFLASQKI